MSSHRLLDRWVHLPSGRVYNQSYNPPKIAGIDDATGEALAKRPDDNPVSIPFCVLVDIRPNMNPTGRRRVSSQVLL